MTTNRKRPCIWYGRAWERSAGWARLVTSLIALAGTAMASEYPPPPGPYQSEPIGLPPAAPPAGGQPTAATPSSKMLPLPAAGETKAADPFAASNLFGAPM